MVAAGWYTTAHGKGPRPIEVLFCGGRHAGRLGCRECQTHDWKNRHKGDCKQWAALQTDGPSLEDQETRMKVRSSHAVRWLARHAARHAEAQALTHVFARSCPPPPSSSSHAQLHNREFRRIVFMYGLDKGAKADQLADLLTDQDGHNHIAPEQLASQFDIPRDDAATLLSWIEVGVRFKEQALDSQAKLG